MSDWMLGFAQIENQILEKFDTPSKCLMLLKYMVSNNEDISLWSYYLKTLVVQMVINNPDEEFWANKNLFSAFKTCLERLYRSVLLTDLHDTFDPRLKLLQISFIEDDRYWNLPTYPEKRTWLGYLERRLMRRSRKLLPAKNYKTMTLRLQHLTTQMIETSSKGF